MKIKKLFMKKKLKKIYKEEIIKLIQEMILLIMKAIEKSQWKFVMIEDKQFQFLI